MCELQSDSPRTQREIVSVREAAVKTIALVVSWGALYFLGIALHETGHLIVAWAGGVHVDAFRWYDPMVGGSVVQISYETPNLAVRVGPYMGGIFAGLVMLGAGLLLRKRLRKSTLPWLIGLALFQMACVQIGLGFAEGLTPGSYYGATPWAWGSAATANLAGMISGFAVYWLAMKWR